MNTAFTALFFIECTLKIISFGVKVFSLICLKAVFTKKKVGVTSFSRSVILKYDVGSHMKGQYTYSLSRPWNCLIFTLEFTIIKVNPFQLIIYLLGDELADSI